MSYKNVAWWMGPPLNDQTYSQKVKSVFGSSLIAYWPLWELSGVVANDISGNGRNGSYIGVTLGQTGIGDGYTCPLFDGANDYVSLPSAALQGVFSGDEFTISLWAKVFNPGIWLDGVSRRLIVVESNSGDQIRLYKSAINNTIQAYYADGSKFLSKTLSSIDWVHLAFTGSRAADQLLLYLNADVPSSASGQGAWGGSLNNCLIGAVSTSPTQVFGGYVAHVALANAALSPANIAKLAVV